MKLLPLESIKRNFLYARIARLFITSPRVSSMLPPSARTSSLFVSGYFYVFIVLTKFEPKSYILVTASNSIS